MRYAADVPTFLGAIVLGLGLAIGWTAGCWLTSKLLSFLK